MIDTGAKSLSHCLEEIDEYILLVILSELYWTITLHIYSKETMAYLATKPNRFIYVHTPKHGSWLNMVEMLFGKMARTFLKHIRVQNKEELIQRIYLGIKR